MATVMQNIYCTECKKTTEKIEEYGADFEVTLQFGEAEEAGKTGEQPHDRGGAGEIFSSGISKATTNLIAPARSAKRARAPARLNRRTYTGSAIWVVVVYGREPLVV